MMAAITVHDAARTLASLRSAAANLKAADNSLRDCGIGVEFSPPVALPLRDLHSRLASGIVIYCDHHLPLTAILVENLAYLMRLYAVLDVPTFCERIQFIAGEVKAAADRASKVIEVHERLLEDLTKFYEEMLATVSTTLEATTLEKQALQARREKRKEALKKKKRIGKTMAAILECFCVDVDVSFEYDRGARVYKAVYETASAYPPTCVEREIMEESELEECNKAARIIRDSLTSTVNNFVEAIVQVAGFLVKLEADTSKYARNASKIVGSRNAIAIYLEVLKSHSAKIQDACNDCLLVFKLVPPAHIRRLSKVRRTF